MKGTRAVPRRHLNLGSRTETKATRQKANAVLVHDDTSLLEKTRHRSIRVQQKTQDLTAKDCGRYGTDPGRNFYHARYLGGNAGSPVLTNGEQSGSFATELRASERFYTTRIGPDDLSRYRITLVRKCCRCVNG